MLNKKRIIRNEESIKLRRTRKSRGKETHLNVKVGCIIVSRRKSGREEKKDVPQYCKERAA